MAFFLLVYGMMITRRRGGILALLLGLGLLILCTLRHVPRRAIVLVLALVVLAYATAELTWQGGVSARLAALLDPVRTTSERLLIWRQSWELLRQSPWWGVGLGLYSLFWERYRHPHDGSAGFFAHNDYLQLWIEVGLPGLILFLAVLAAAGWLFARLLRDRRLAGEDRIETAGLFAGFIATAAHALIEFPFYIPPILAACGLVLARIQSVAMVHGSVGTWTLRPARYVSRGGLRAITAAAALLPLAYFTALGVSSLDLQRGVDLAAGAWTNRRGAGARAAPAAQFRQCAARARRSASKHYRAEPGAHCAAPGGAV